MLLSPAGSERHPRKLMARLAVGWTQMALVLATGVLVFRVTFAAHPVLLVAFLSLYALAIGAVGILIARCSGIRIRRTPSHLDDHRAGAAQRHLVAGGNHATAVAAARGLLANGWAMRAVNAMLAFNAGLRTLRGSPRLTSLLIFSFTLASVRLRAT